jgi:hypothetical protein
MAMMIFPAFAPLFFFFFGSVCLGRSRRSPLSNALINQSSSCSLSRRINVLKIHICRLKPASFSNLLLSPSALKLRGLLISAVIILLGRYVAVYISVKIIICIFSPLKAKSFP